MHTSRPFQSAHHVFASAPPAPDTNFFVLSFSLNCRKVSLIDAPPAIVKDVKKALMHAAPYGLEEDGCKGDKGSRRKKSSMGREHPAFSGKEKARSFAESTTSIQLLAINRTTSGRTLLIKGELHSYVALSFTLADIRHRSKRAHHRSDQRRNPGRPEMYQRTP